VLEKIFFCSPAKGALHTADARVQIRAASGQDFEAEQSVRG